MTTLVFGSAAAQSKFTPSALSAVESYKQFIVNPKERVAEPVGMPVKFDRAGRGETTAAFFVTLAPGYFAEDLTALGLDVVSQAGNIVVVEAPILAMKEAAESPAIKAIDINAYAEPLLDRARKGTGVDKIHSGEGFSQGFTGKGVICGIFDTGIDPNHLNFYNSEATESRVKSVFHYFGTAGSVRRYQTPEAIAGFTTDAMSATHGTHTLGCMAGANKSKTGRSAGMNGRFAYTDDDGNHKVSTGSVLKPGDVLPNPYYGMAPDADIALACGQLTDANIAAGVTEIAKYAQQQGKPAVINLSIGNVRGSHDSHDSFNQMLDNISEEYGSIIFVAAGNDGGDNISITKTLTASNNSVRTFFNCGSSSSLSGSISIWASDGKAFTVRPVIYNNSTGKIVYDAAALSKQGTIVLASSNYTDPSYLHSEVFDQAFSSGCHFRATAALNTDAAANYSRYGVSADFNLSFNNTSNANKNLVIALIVEGTAGQRIDMTMNGSGSQIITFSDGGVSGWDNGTPDFTISGMATGKNTISIGAWNTRDKWPVIGGGVWQYQSESPVGEIADYSSYGVGYDGTKYPLVCAPGTGIVSSINSYYAGGSTDYDNSKFLASYVFNGRMYLWDIEQGTSMATPIVAGAVATWLEADKDLTYAQVKDIMARTASQDEFTAAAAKKCGNGKFDALAGLKEILKAGVNDIVADRNDGIIVSTVAANVFDVFAAGAHGVNAAVYNMQGAMVAKASTDDSNVQLDLSNQPAGIYIINVNGAKSERVVVK